MKKSVFMIASLILVMISASCTKAPSSPINAGPDGVAIKGFDPVAYFTVGKPVKGNKQFAYSWNDATWLFSTRDHQDLFKQAPAKYAPQYGGYWAYAVSRGTTADIDPEAWSIVDGKLYLNLNSKVQNLWKGDIPGNIKKADRNWPEVLRK